MREFEPDGGGPVVRPGQLVLTPASPINLGNVVVAATATANVVVQNTGTGALTVTVVAAPGAEWSLGGVPALPVTLLPQGSFTITVNLTPTGAGAKATTLTVSWDDAYGVEPDATLAVTGTGIAPGTHIGSVNPAALVCATIQVGHSHTYGLILTNVGSAAFQVTGLALTTGTQFSINPPIATPFTLNPGDTKDIDILFAPTTVGALADTLTITTDLAGNILVSLQGLCLLVLPIAICVNNDRRVWLGGFDNTGLAGKPAPLIVTPDSYDSDQAGAVVFNGAIWQGMGAEKTLMRLGFYYENFGVATLTGQVSVNRPQSASPSNPDTFQVVPFSIVLGTALADGTERYAEVDCVATGELITLSLARAASSGPVSIEAIIPYFEPRGEKVRDV